MKRPCLAPHPRGIGFKLQGERKTRRLDHMQKREDIALPDALWSNDGAWKRSRTATATRRGLEELAPGALSGSVLGVQFVCRRMLTTLVRKVLMQVSLTPPGCGYIPNRFSLASLRTNHGFHRRSWAFHASQRLLGGDSDAAANLTTQRR